MSSILFKAELQTIETVRLNSPMGAGDLIYCVVALGELANLGIEPTLAVRVAIQQLAAENAEEIAKKALDARLELTGSLSEGMIDDLHSSY